MDEASESSYKIYLNPKVYRNKRAFLEIFRKVTEYKRRQALTLLAESALNEASDLRSAIHRLHFNFFSIAD